VLQYVAYDGRSLDKIILQAGQALYKSHSSQENKTGLSSRKIRLQKPVFSLLSGHQKFLTYMFIYPSGIPECTFSDFKYALIQLSSLI
jgi:hypothetical protein